MALFDSPRLGASGTALSYEIDRSLRFGGDDSRLRIGQASGNQQIFTFSVWLKRTALSNGTNTISSATFNVGGQFGFYFLSDDKLQVREYNGQSNSETIDIRTRRVFRDISSWFHLVVAIDTTQGTSTNRAKVYVNGEQVTDFSTTSYPSQNQNFMVNSNYDNQRFHIGVENYAGTSNEFQGYIAEYNFIDGQQLAPSNFGETNSDTGQWVPINTSGLTFGTNGFYLNFSDNSGTTATTLGKDSSGNGNNFTPNNFSVSAGTDNDSLVDTPTNNFPVWNPLYTFKQTGGSTSYSEGNLKLNTTANTSGGGSLYPFGFTTFGPRSGKWYAEFKCDTGNVAVGVANTGQLDSDVTSNPYGATANTSIIYTSRGEVRSNDGYASQSEATYSSGDVIGVALDLDNNKIYFHKNGSYQNSGNPSTGSNGFVLNTIPTGMSGDFVFSCGSDGVNNIGVFANIGQIKTASTSYSDAGGIGSFDYAVPTGYKAVCTKNLPDPTIAFPEKHFDTRTYTGTGQNNTQTLTGFDFSPDWVWGKNRTDAYNHGTFDTVRGATNRLWPNITNAEASNNALTAFTSDGYTVSTDAFNQNSQVTWNWEAADSNSTNNDGSVSATIRANTTAGFSICSWTGTGSNLTVGHGLGVKPAFYLVKARSGSSGCDWFVYHHFFGATKNLRFNQSSTVSSSSDLFNNTEPTSSVFSIGNSSCINENGGTYITYVFAEVNGYSKFGRYTGNQSSDGTYIDLGFKPELIIIKNTTNTHNWRMHDLTRQPENMPSSTDGHLLEPNNSVAESNEYDIDFLSNGFKLRVDRVYSNNSNSVFAYFAWAKSPFKYSRGS